MTNSNDNRDDELELIRQLLIATANRTESTDTKFERLLENQDHTQRQLDQLTVKQDRTQEQLDQLSGKVDQLGEDVDIAFQTISLMSQNTDREMAEFRTAILGIQEENRRIWQYLLSQQRNGNGNEPQA